MAAEQDAPLTGAAPEPDEPVRQPAADPTRPAIALDAKGLRALAHPVRVQLLGLLRRHGPSTATQLAERTGLTSGATSYHLRQLAAAGFIDEETERGSGRERWWRSRYYTVSLMDEELVEREPEATLVYLQSVAANYTMRAQRGLNEFQTLPRPWREVFELSDWALRLTPEEARQLKRELEGVLGRYRWDTAQARATAPEGAERVGFIVHYLPELGIDYADEPGPVDGPQVEP